MIDWPGVGAGAGPIPLGTLAGAPAVPGDAAPLGAVPLGELGPLVCARADVAAPNKQNTAMAAK